MLALLHLCDSLFPLGSFAYSDGLETATSNGAVRDVRTLEEWADAVLDEVFVKLDGPGVSMAWTLIAKHQWDALAVLDEEIVALRPSSSGRRSIAAMGQRLASTWRALHPHALLDALAAQPALVPTLPVAFAAACVTSDVDRVRALEAFAYTRLAATMSAAMRLAPIGQSEAHGLLARMLERVPAAAARVAESPARPSSYTPALDVAAMSQQYLHSRLFRS